MLSTIPKIVDKAFVIGYVIPVVLFFVALLFVTNDLPLASDLYSALSFSGINGVSNGPRFVKASLYLLILLWTTSIISLILNHVLFQFLEGYIWPIPIIAQLLGKRAQAVGEPGPFREMSEAARFKRSVQRREALKEQSDQLKEKLRYLQVHLRLNKNSLKDDLVVKIKRLNPVICPGFQRVSQSRRDQSV